MTSTLKCDLTILHAISLFGKEGVPAHDIVTHNEQQERLMKLYDRFKSSLHLFENNIQSRISDDSDVINRFLAENGFSDISVSECGPDEYAVASILKVLFEWNMCGYESSIEIRGRRYVGATLPCLSFSRSHEHDEAFAGLMTKDNDIIYVTKSKEPLSEDVIYSLHASNDYNGVSFPAVDFQNTPDISFVRGLTINPGRTPTIIVQAVQQNKFEMDHKGGKMESAVGMVANSGCIGTSDFKPTLYIDSSFSVFAIRQGIPFFSAFIDTDGMRLI